MHRPSGIEHNWKGFSPPNQEGVELILSRLTAAGLPGEVEWHFQQQMFSNVQVTLARKLLSRARDQLALYTFPVDISTPVVVVISCSSRVSSIHVRLYDVYALADCRRAAVGAEEVITGFRVHTIKTAAIFAAMDITVEELKETVRESFGVDTAKYGLPHKVEWANIHNAWLSVKVNQEVKSKPIQYLTADWASMIFQFNQQYGMNVHDAKLPSQSFFESFEERLHNGVIEAETLAHVVTLEEERVQIASKPELPTQMVMHLDSTLTLHTKEHLPYTS